MASSPASNQNSTHDSMSRNSRDCSQDSPHVNDPERERTPTPLPVLPIAILWFLQLCEPITNTVIYPFVNEFVRNLEITGGDDRRVGYYVGLIESTFFLTESLCVLHWGRLSDIIGRRPVILMGLAGITLSIISFGIARTFLTAVLARSLAGMLNGNIGTIKSTITEISDETNLVAAFAYMPLCWPVGETIGPLIGGHLSNPSKKYPGLFANIKLWTTFPYLLPCLAAACFPIVGFVVTYMLLPETVAKPRQFKDMIRIIRRKYMNRGHERTPLLDIPSDGLEVQTLRSILTRRVLLAILNYALLALINIGFSVLQPLFLSTPIEHGGLGLSPAPIGYVLGAQGVAAAVTVLTLSARLQNRFGTKRVLTVAMSSFLILFAAFPAMNMLAAASGKVTSRVYAVMGVQILLFGLVNIGYGCIFIIVNQSAPSRASLGSTNGLAQTAASIMRALGPASTTALFALSIERQIMGGRLVYFIMLGLTVVAIGTTALLEENKPRRIFKDQP